MGQSLEQPEVVAGRWVELAISTDLKVNALLDGYLTELGRFNKRLNLVSSATISKADAVHIGDAVRAWSLIASSIPAGSVVYDFGSGNGIPGIIFAILDHVAGGGRKFRLVDRDQRKLEFLKHVSFKLGLSNTSFSNSDVSSLPDGSVEFAVCRGFAPVTTALLTTMKPLSSKGVFFMMKSEGWSREVADIPTQIFGFWQVEMVGQYKLPDTAADFVVIRARKA